LKNVIKAKYGQDACNVGDEGGFAPSIQDNYEGVDLLMEAIKKTGYEKEVKIGMDVAASEFLTKDGKYDLDFKSPTNDGSMVMTGEELGNVYADLCQKYPMVSIEDPYDQDDWENYAKFTERVGKDVQIVGDDLLVTNVTKIKEASEKKVCYLRFKPSTATTDCD
jgi:enolase